MVIVYRIKQKLKKQRTNKKPPADEN